MVVYNVRSFGITTLLGDTGFCPAVDELCRARTKVDKVASPPAARQSAPCKLLRRLGIDIVAACFVIDLPGLGGAKKPAAVGVSVRSLIAFEGH